MSGGGDTPVKTLIRVSNGGDYWVWGYVENGIFLYTQNGSYWLADNTSKIVTTLGLPDVALIPKINAALGTDFSSIDKVESVETIGDDVPQWDEMTAIP